MFFVILPLNLFTLTTPCVLLVSDDNFPSQAYRVNEKSLKKQSKSIPTKKWFNHKYILYCHRIEC